MRINFVDTSRMNCHQYCRCFNVNVVAVVLRFYVLVRRSDVCDIVR